MPLDFKIIELSKKFCDKKLNQAEFSSHGLIFVKDFLPSFLLEKLKDFVSTTENWIDAVQLDMMTVDSHRQKIAWVPDSVIEETHIVMESLTATMSNIFHKDLVFDGILLWKDEKGYEINPHTDNPIISVSLQIYLSSGDKKLGTKFYTDDGILQVDYSENSGYIADNEPGIMHSMDGGIMKEHTRYSLYAMWKNRL